MYIIVYIYVASMPLIIHSLYVYSFLQMLLFESGQRNRATANTAEAVKIF